MSEVLEPQDKVGSATLRALASATRYNAWQVDLLRPHIGKRIIEIGSGIGNISVQLRKLDPERLIVTDLDPAYRAELSGRFAGDDRVTVDSLYLPAPDVAERFGPLKLDTAIALNVVEHIEDDIGAVRSMKEALVPGGRVVVMVPAMPSIYGRMDEALGHFRRYDRSGLQRVFEAAGLRIETLTWFNRAGVPAWWFRGKVRGKPTLDPGGITLFDQLVPIFRLEKYVPLPFGQSLIAVGSSTAP